MHLVKREKHIYCVLQEEKDGDDVYLPGYYFADEGDLLHGPFTSFEETKHALKLYAENL